jgi:imidazoleglycerol-phosphate dehydratase
MNARSATLARTSNETNISLDLNLDGTGVTDIATGIGLLDHLLTLTAFWAGFDLRLRCEGDTHIDGHHSAEDIGLVLGQALLAALGDKAGIERVGFARDPMDDSLADVCLDISGRAWLEWRGEELLPPVLGGEERDLWREHYKALASAARVNLHISYI